MGDDHRGRSGALNSRLESILGSPPASLELLDGGEVGTVHRVDLEDGRTVVAKTGETPLSVEATMVQHLTEHSELPVPDVLFGDDDLLVLSYIDGDGEITPPVERDAADHLSELHNVTSHAFGFECDTLDGPIPQPNPWTDEWIPFFREQRLLHCAELAFDGGHIPEPISDRVRALADDLEEHLVEPEQPGLVHGDPWTGNVIVDGERVAAWLDPAIYYGHPEVDLAYVAWTETFGTEFFKRYQERRGIEPGFFERRLDVYVCHPILVHTIVFDDPRYVRELDRRLSELGY